MAVFCFILLSKRIGYGTYLRVIVVHVFGIPDAVQEGVVVLILFGVIATLYHTNIYGAPAFASEHASRVCASRTLPIPNP